MMINIRLLNQVGMDLKIHVNLIIFFSTEMTKRATSWHPFDLAFKIAVDNSKDPIIIFTGLDLLMVFIPTPVRFIDGSHSNSSHLHILFPPQSSEPPACPDLIDGGTYASTFDVSVGHLRQFPSEK
jgi:hypothetical protein